MQSYEVSISRVGQQHLENIKVPKFGQLKYEILEKILSGAAILPKKEKGERKPMPGGKKKIPFAEGMWTIKSEDQRPKLLGSRCPSCGELFFPRKEKGICVHCQYPSLENVELGREGKIVSFTAVLQAPAGGAYFGPVPYIYGLVDLDEGVRIETQLGGEIEKLKVGCRVVLTIETLYMDKDGNEVEAFKFRPLDDPKLGGK